MHAYYVRRPYCPWYRKPTPGWIDSFEVQPIVETDEMAEEDDVIYEQEGEEEPAVRGKPAY
jgi:hypothetical protein